MVALPGQLFYSTQIPACLWLLARDRGNGKFRNRQQGILFIDARGLGRMVDRTHRELTDGDIARISNTYHTWRSGEDNSGYADVPGFCYSAPLDEMCKHGHVLTPGRYVGTPPQKEDDEPFQKKMKGLVTQLCEQQDDSAKLDWQIAKNLEALGFGELIN